jgi:hypothetical protein
MTYTTVIRLSESLTVHDREIIEERIGMNDATISILVEKGQVTVDIEADNSNSATEISEKIVSDVQEIDSEAECELVTLNPSEQSEEEEDEESDEGSDEEEADAFDDFDDDDDE